MDHDDATASSSVEEAVVGIFGERAPLARRFVHHLTTTGVERGLLGPREVPRIWTRHVLNCAVIGELIGEQEQVADVGAGAGLPGIALALARPDLSLILIEPLLRRVIWLEEVVQDLELEQVTVLRGRAEDVSTDVTVDVAVARAVAPLGVLARWCLPLVRPHGRLLAIKGRNAEEEVQSSRDVLRAWGAENWRIARVGRDHMEEPTTVVEVVSGTVPTQKTKQRGPDSPRRRKKKRSS